VHGYRNRIFKQASAFINNSKCANESILQSTRRNQRVYNFGYDDLGGEHDIRIYHIICTWVYHCSVSEVINIYKWRAASEHALNDRRGLTIFHCSNYYALITITIPRSRWSYLHYLGSYTPPVYRTFPFNRTDRSFGRSRPCKYIIHRYIVYSLIVRIIAARAPCYCTQRRLSAQIFGRTFISTNHPLRDVYRRETDRGNRRLIRNIIIYDAMMCT